MVAMFRVKTEFTGLAGSPGLNQLYFTASVGTPALVTVAVGNFWDDALGQSGSALNYEVLPDVDIVESTTGQITSVVAGTGSSGSGGGAGQELPPATQALLRLRTGVFENGREIRGKVFVPGVTEAGSDSGTVSPAVQSAIQGAFDALMANTNANWLVYSRKNFSAASVSSGSVWNQFAVLRSRRD